MRISTLFDYCLSIPKSLYVNLKLLPIKEAIKLKLLVKYDVKLIQVNGNAELWGGGRFWFGFGQVSEFQGERSILSVRGRLVILGSASFGPGSRLIVEPNGKLVIGRNFRMNAYSTITCWNSITFGDNCLLSWGIHISDTDYHYTINTDNNSLSPLIGNIYIGNDVWICMRTIILKNTLIPNGCIVGAFSLVNKKFDETYSLIAGNPAVVKKSHVRLAKKGEYPNIWPQNGSWHLSR